MARIAKWFLILSLLAGPALATTLVAPDGQVWDRYGWNLSLNGNTLVIGGAYEVGEPGGKTVYVYQKTGNSWNNPVLVAELTAVNGDWLEGVAVSGNTIVVGAPAATVNGVQYQGCAYIFVAGAGGWRNAHETAKLTSSDGYFNNGFGLAVAIDKRTVVIGASQAGSVGQGEAYEFTEPPTGWVNATEAAKPLSSNGQQYDAFGTSVSVNGVVAVVGAFGVGYSQTGNLNGAAYLFQETRGGWRSTTETAELTMGQPIQGEELGGSVVIQSGTVVAGAPGSGRALVYLKPVRGWQSSGTPVAVLSSTEVNPQGFGLSVAINPSLIIVGDPYASATYRKYSGAAFLFKKPLSGWVDATQSEKFVASGVNVGESVGASANKVVFMGAPGTTVKGNIHQGVAFVQHVK